MIHVVADQYVDQNNKEAYLSLAKELIDETRKEEGCVFYGLHEDVDKEGHLTFIEKWESKAHLEAHFETVHFKKLVPMMGELLKENGSVDIYKTVL